MPTVRKPKTTSQPFSAAEIALAKAAAAPPSSDAPAIEWGKGVVTRGGGVATTIGEIRRRTRGPNRSPTKEQIAIRFDKDVLDAFRAGGAGWQTRMNSALKEWLVTHRVKRKAGRVPTRS